jgi:hypothetical protein
MPGWPGGLGNRLQGGRAVVDQGLGDRLQAEPGLIDQWKASLANRILSAPSKLFGGLVVDPAMDLATLAGDVIHGRQPTMAADPQTGEFHTDPRLINRTNNAAGMLTLGAGAVPAEANSLRMGIKAYHGSPHDFERFDSSKIGTGEGAQAYGHGLYFGEREGVAKEYRKKLTAGRYKTSSGETLSQGDLFQELMKAADQVKQGGYSAENRFALHPDHRRSVVNRMVDGVEEYGSVDKYLENSGFTPGFEELQGAVANRAKELGLKPDKGRMYEVDIAADPEHFLDWDKPLSEQSPKVQETLKGLGAAQKNRPLAEADSGRDLYYKQTQGLTSDTASQRLKEAGIPGIRYLDQGSRTAGEGSRNYVVFDDKLISILKKYGLPISAAGLAALSQLHPQEAQAQPLGDRLQGR